MYIPFNQLSNEARIWIYQANRPFAREEVKTMLQKTKTFLEGWASHGNPLQGSATMIHEQFLILAIEESFQSATGCAVDVSVQFIRELEQGFQVGLLDRTQIAFRKGSSTLVVPMSQIKEKIQQGIISAVTPIFDNTITQKAALASKWLVRARDSWLSKYFHTPYQATA